MTRLQVYSSSLLMFRKHYLVIKFEKLSPYVSLVMYLGGKMLFLVGVIGNLTPKTEFLWQLGTVTGIWDIHSVSRLMLAMTISYAHN